ncbi:hypothetical protein C2E23DRAFT_726359 [Lenzites betulinus]|nr:hypothetical protein C2E23DRAFT_726359 [Lenzites betulinus]
MSEAESQPGDVESEASASAFEPDDAEEQSDEWEEDDVVAVQPVRKANRRLAKVHRTDITAVRSNPGVPPKRKSVTSSIDLGQAEQASGEASKKPRISATPTGLRTGWNAPTSSTTPLAPKGKHSQATGSAALLPTQRLATTAPSLSTTPRPTKSAAPTSVRQASSLRELASQYQPAHRSNNAQNTPARDAEHIDYSGLNEYGGLQDEDDSAEAAAASTQSAAKWKLKALDSEPSMSEEDTFPEDTMTEVAHVPARTVTNMVRVSHRPPGLTAQNRRRWTTNDLDEIIRQRFTHVFIPLTRTSMSRMPPWHSMSIDERQTLFDRVFPSFAHPIEMNDMNSRITEWQSKFAAAALTVLDNHFVKTGMAQPEVRATWCREQLGTSVAAMKAPFMWETWDSGKKKGCFQGELVLKTFGIVHIPVIQAVPQELRATEGDSEGRPCGALILAVLAVERALSIWLTGTRVIQSGAPGHFSADNWGDRTVVLRGVAKSSTKVAKLFERAQKMSCERWIAIIDAARAHYRRHKAIPSGISREVCNHL